MTMTNAEWMINTGHKFIELDAKYIDQEHGCRITINGKTVERVPLVNRASAIICWLDAEHKEPILDDAEKRYLSAVIRPFRDRAVFVKKIYHVGSYEQIIMRVKSIATDTDFTDIPFPFFKKGTMYKGMELGKEYTLEELGL